LTDAKGAKRERELLEQQMSRLRMYQTSLIFPICLTTALICYLMLGGCSRRPPPAEDATAESIGERMIHIENFSVTEKTLMLDYKVSNPFEYDIWVCEDIDITGKYEVETRISPGTLRIKLCFNLESNVFIYNQVFAKYRLLMPGESHSGKIHLNLPVKSASPVYVFSEIRKELKREILTRAIFEVGYLKGEVINKTLEIMKLVRLDDPSAKKADNMPEIKEEIINGQSCKLILAPYYWQGLSEEKSAEVVITDVEIPGILLTNPPLEN